MARLFNHVPLAAVLGLAIGRIACADAIYMPEAGNSAVSAGITVVSQSSRLPLSFPPLRLALALVSERQHGTVLPGEREQEHVATQPITYGVRLSHAANPAPAAPAADAAFPAFNRSPLQSSPLRLALALSTEKPRATPKPSRQFAELARNDTAPQQNKDAPASDAGQMWEISPSDRTLNATLVRWSASAGWQLVWDMEVDYPIETRAVLQGTFQEAVATVAQSLAAASVPVQATFYEGNRVLRIVAKGSK